MNIRSVIIALFMALGLASWGQNQINPVKEEQMPDMPSIAKLKEVSIPSPSLVTGAAELEIPIYTLAAGDLNLPITLRYRSNGIKPDDDPYPVGLGWSLSPGLKIVRSIRGRADGSFPFLEGYDNRPTHEMPYEKLLSCVARYDIYNEQDIKHNINKTDSEHDIFTVILPETVLTLMYVDGHFIGVNCDEYKITVKQDFSEIQVINPLGHIYNFKRDGQKILIDGDTYNLEWLLSDIILPSGKKIEFSWDLAFHDSCDLNRYTSRISYGYHTYDTSVESDGQTASWSHNSTFHKEIKSIKYENCRIEFEYDDGTGPYINALRNIAIYWNNEKKYYINLKHKSLPYNSRGYPILLESITHSADGTYSFNYYPDHTSGGYDWWGYCNGVEETIYHLPEITLQYGLTKSKDFKVLGRSFDISETHMKSNLLHSVCYPTGGRAVWNYEVHQFEPIEEPETFKSYIGNERLDKGGGLRVKSIELYESDTDSEPRVRSYSYSTGKCVTAPLLSTFLNSYIHEGAYKFSDRSNRYAYFLRRNVVEIGSTSNYLEYQDGVHPIWYEEVTEYENFGKTVYKFRSLIPNNKINRKFGRIMPDSLYSFFSTGPQLVEKHVYKSTRTIGDDFDFGDSTKLSVFREPSYYNNLYSEYYDYELVSLPAIYNVAIKRNIIQTQMTDYAPDFNNGDVFYLDLNKMNLPQRYPLSIQNYVPLNEHIPPIPLVIDKSDIYEYSAYAVVPMRERLKSKRRVEYPAGEISTNEEYSYIPGTGIIDKVVTRRLDESTTLNLGYIPDGAIGSTMRERNMVGVVTSSSTTFGSSTSKAEYLMAKWNGNIIKPKELKISRGASSYTAQSFLYDDYGNIREIRRPDGFCTVYLWGYGGLYPVYKFSGLPFSEIMRIYGSTISTNSAETLNLNLANVSCPAEFAEYNPLFGLSAYTNAAGVTSRYKYDSAGRLSETSTDGLGTTATYSYNIGGNKPNFAAEEIWVNSNGSHRMRSVETFDGLGRSISRVNSYPQGLVADYTVFDALGRPVQAWLPTPVDSEHPSFADIKSSATEAYSDSRPYSASEYEPSAEGRLLSTLRPGNAWHSADKKAKFQRYSNNTLKLSIPRYAVTSGGIEHKGRYAVNSLLVEESVDEDGITVQTFTDFRGLKVAERRGNRAEWLTTRYVYDDYGDLRYVLPPKLADGSYSRTDSDMQELAYWYDYDARGNATLKKLPGRSPIIYRYDSAGRLVAVQDGNMAPRWQLLFYDRFGNVAVEAQADWSEATLASFIASPCVVSHTGSGALGGYATDRPLPGIVDVIHVIRRYDSAGRIISENAGTTCRSYQYNSLGQISTLTVDYGQTKLTHSYRYNHRGFQTSEIVTSSDIELPALRILKFHDSAGRHTGIRAELSNSFSPIIAVDQPITDSLAATRVEYDRLGRPVRRRFGLRGNTYYDYDINGGIATQKSTIVLAPLRFDPNDLITIPFRSNISAYDSISIKIPDPFEPGPILKGPIRVFADTLLRADGSIPLYNGRISSRKTRDGRYDYTYDSFGRLTAAAFSGNGDADYSTEYTYDDNANLTGLLRKGVVDRAGKSKIYGILDVTNVTLEGNRAVGYDIESDGDVFEGRTGFGSLSGYCEVQYDDNGNVAYDETTMTAYSYNRHNKPVLIEADDGSSLSFEYDGTGTLISRTQTSGGVTTKTEYIGPYELVDGEFKAAYFDGGYFDADGMVHYYVPDYQGNIIADVTAGGKIVQTASYYPYGEPWLEPEGDNRRLFAAKERLNFGGIRHSDFGARFLDSRAGIWTTQDPCAEDFYPYSPYSVCLGDPINFVDNNGKKPKPKEALLMANYSYPKENQGDNWQNLIEQIQHTGWELSYSMQIEIAGYENYPNLEAWLFEKSLDNGEKEYTCAFAGSTWTWESWKSNANQLTGSSKQYADCVEFAKNLSEKIGDSELTFVGHSQGGGKAAASSMATGRNAITFNPAALHPNTISKLNLGLANNVVNYIISGIKINHDLSIGGDPVYNLQRNILNLTPPGRNIYIPSNKFFPHDLPYFKFD